MAVWPIYPFLCKTASWMWNHFNIVIWTLVPAFSGNLGSNNIEFTVFDIDLTLYNVTRSKRSFFFGARTINPNGEVRFSTEWWMNFTMTIPKELTTMKNEPNVDKWEPFKTKNHIALHRTRITHVAGRINLVLSLIRDFLVFFSRESVPKCWWLYCWIKTPEFTNSGKLQLSAEKLLIKFCVHCICIEYQWGVILIFPANSNGRLMALMTPN